MSVCRWRVRLLLLLVLVAPASVWAQLRVVSLAPNWSHTVAELGQEDSLVGVTRYARFPDSIPQRVARGELAVVGGFTDIDVAAVLALKPDLVLTATGLQQRLQQSLQQQGVRVIHMQERSLEEVYLKIQALGQALDVPKAADAMVEQIQSELAGIARQYAHQPRVSVYYEINYLYKCVPGADSYMTELIRMVGGEPVFGDRPGIAPAVNWNEVVVANPQVMLMPLWPNAGGPVFDGPQAGSGTTTVAEVRAREQADKVDAVRLDQVRYIDSAVTKQAGPSIPLAARLLAEAIHGD
ncbi:ABC-type Fe3+-hydroxamate transport system, substrate-binding protein [Ferrimonas sediminum]|uniref:ABC-type Fe3+-hydroxamate transport system, substrate-binding protein n=1 Tax=Ferrimonas sediminum TaxID=718193 RepID=A0A1G8RZK8_9GAMM|nr:helical backbone metal receptor [Ferrimonas sediminum]SDJ21850.1 ABC-type Fe3+-hydroxamate transport system, substrate-binding protein [Ferrimonas sediminum]